MGSRTARVRASAVAALVLAILAVACGGGSSSTSTSSSSTSTLPEWTDRSGTWTVLAYVDADNNLEGQALRDIVQMTKATTTTFIVLIDRIAGYSSADLLGLGDFTDSALLQIQDGTAKVLQTPGEINMGSADTLASFVSFGLTNFKGQKNALVLWDHGGSWKGVAWDDSSSDPANPQLKDRLTLSEVSAGMKRGLADAGVARFDLVGFDACLMATYEVAVAVAPFADVMVASEETEPGHGWNWTTLGTSASGATTAQFSDSILQGYKSEAAAAEQVDVTLSTIDLHALPALTAAVDDLTGALRASNVRVGRVGYGRNQAIGFGKSPDPEQDYFSVDLGAFASELEHIGGMEDAAAALHAAVHDVVIRRVSGAASEESTGIAAYFPPVEQYFDPSYEAGGFGPSWLRMLDSYFGAAARVPDSNMPAFLDQDRVLENDNVMSSSASIELLAKVTSGTGGNIISGFIYFGELAADNDLIKILGEINAEVAGDTVSGSYGWRSLVISDGVTKTVAFASINLDADKRITKITVPILLTDGVETVQGSLVLNMDGEDILAETFFQISDDGMAAVEPQVGISFVPLYESFRLSTERTEWLPTTSTPLATSSTSLSFDFVRLPVGTKVFAGLGIQDIKGGVDLVVHRTAAPAE